MTNSEPRAARRAVRPSPAPGDLSPARFGGTPADRSPSGPALRRGIYVHVPFCARKCYYCDFNSYRTHAPLVEPYVRALRRELEARAERWRAEAAPVSTLFIGGGTPTTLPPEQLGGIVRAVDELFPVADGWEVTVEANPGSADAEAFDAMLGAGVNRLSLGVQSLDDGLLARLGRVHTSAEAVEVYRKARRAGFANVNVDLMFGIPGQRLSDWRETLEGVLEMEPDHLSCYSLIVEEGTPFAVWHRKGRLDLPDEDEAADMFDWTIDRLARSGYRHYEVSNFAMPQKESLHNRLYWENQEWLGVGPGAASKWEGRRFANVRPPRSYIAAVERSGLAVHPGTVEEMTPEQEMDETMMVGLRLREGVSLAGFARRFGRALEDVYGEPLRRLLGQGLLEIEGDRLRLTERGLMVGNVVFGSFLRDDAP